MDRSKVAELLLSSVLPAEQAAAVTGDFVEEFSGRGGFWFWSSVLRTVAARVASDFIRHPVSLFGVGIAGCLLSIAPVIVLAAIAAPLAQYGHRWIPELIAWLGILPWRVQCGRALARWKPGSALASCIAVILLGWACILIVHTTPPRSTVHFVMSGVQDVLLISGALWARYRDVRRMWGPARG